MAHHQFQKLISTLVLSMVIIKTANSESQCIIKELSRGKDANCRRLNLTEIPQTLDTDIASLDLSENFLKSIKKHDLERYKGISSFRYIHEKRTPPDKVTTYDRKVFADLIKVEHFELSGNILTGVKLQYPPNVTDLFLQNTMLTDKTADFSYLKKLQILVLTGNNLTKWPKLYKFAPLESIDMVNNPIETFTAKKLARYCNLSYVGIHLNEMASFREDDCECHRMKEWIEKSKGWLPDVVIGMSTMGFSCERNEPYCEDEPIITERMELLHNNCMKGIQDASLDDGDYVPSKKWKKYVLWVFILAILSATAFVIYKIYKKRQEFEVRTAAITSVESTTSTEIPSTMIESELVGEEAQATEEQ